MSGAPIVLLIALLQLFIFLIVLKMVSAGGSWIKQPITWFNTFWLVGLVLLSLPIYKYREEFTIESAAIVIGTLFAFGLGCVFFEFSHRHFQLPATLTPSEASPKEGCDETDAYSIKRWTRLLLLVGIIGTALLCLNSYLNGELSISDRLNSENAALIRQQHQNAAPSAIGPLFGPAAILSAIGVIGYLCYCYYLGRGEIVRIKMFGTRALVWVYTGILLAASALFFGGRMTFVLVVLLGATVFAEGRWSAGRRVITSSLSVKQWASLSASILVSAVFLFTASTYFLEKRINKQEPARMLLKSHRANFESQAFEFIGQSRNAELFLVSLSYLSTPIPTLVYYLNLPVQRMPGPFYGNYNFPAIGRWTYRLSGDFNPFHWELNRQELFGPLESLNFGGNVWPTLLRDLIADFGRVGSMLFVFVLGIFSQKVFVTQREKPAIASACLLVFLRIVLLFSGLVSLLFMSQIYWPLYLSLLLFFFGLREPKRRRRINLSGRQKQF